MRHHTKDKGDVGVLKAQVDLYEKGFFVSAPLTEHAPFDLIATKDGKSYAIQVKYRKINSVGNLDVRFRNVYSDKHGTHVKEVNKNEFDFYCIYCPDVDKCYYFDPKNFNKSLNLRMKPVKNRQQKAIYMACDFEDFPV